MNQESSPMSVHLGYRLVDVFSGLPLTGNGLAVFPEADGLSTAGMLRLAQEMRQFESIFLSRAPQPHAVVARVFTMEEELSFAGHPVLGAACVLHERLADAPEVAEWTLVLPVGPVRVSTTRLAGRYLATMDQGRPAFGPPLDQASAMPLLAALSLSADDLVPGLPLQVVSTGLPYLLVMLRAGLERAAIAHPRLEELLAGVGAKFAYVLDVQAREGRTWDNDGRVEDIATGSAAGPVGAYLVRHGLAPAGTDFELRQGRFVGRPSRLVVRVEGTPQDLGAVLVRGEVCMVARGFFDPPARLAATAPADGSAADMHLP